MFATNKTKSIKLKTCIQQADTRNPTVLVFMSFALSSTLRLKQEIASTTLFFSFKNAAPPTGGHLQHGAATANLEKMIQNHVEKKFECHWTVAKILVKILQDGHKVYATYLCSIDLRDAHLRFTTSCKKIKQEKFQLQLWDNSLYESQNGKMANPLLLFRTL